MYKGKFEKKYMHDFKKYAHLNVNLSINVSAQVKG